MQGAIQVISFTFYLYIISHLFYGEHQHVSSLSDSYPVTSSLLSQRTRRSATGTGIMDRRMDDRWRDLACTFRPIYPECSGLNMATGYDHVEEICHFVFHCHRWCMIDTLHTFFITSYGRKNYMYMHIDIKDTHWNTENFLKSLKSYKLTKPRNLSNTTCFIVCRLD